MFINANALKLNDLVNRMADLVGDHLAAELQTVGLTPSPDTLVLAMQGAMMVLMANRPAPAGAPLLELTAKKAPQGEMPPARPNTLPTRKTTRSRSKATRPSAPQTGRVARKCPECAQPFLTAGRLTNHRRARHGVGAEPSGPSTTAAAAG